MKSRMNAVNAIGGLVLLGLAGGLAAAQQPAPPAQTDPQQQNAYQGQSTPPADDTIQTAPAQEQSQPPQKPSPSVSTSASAMSGATAAAKTSPLQTSFTKTIAASVPHPATQPALTTRKKALSGIFWM